MKYDFHEQLAFSRGARLESDLLTIQSMIDGCTHVVQADQEQDRAGVDYIAHLRRGAQIKIDAKARSKGASRYWRSGPELQLEIWSVRPGGKYQTSQARLKAGWTLSESTDVDMILFTYDPTDTKECFLVPYQPLRIAFRRHLVDWKTTYKFDVQETPGSRGWESECVFVPASVVFAAIEKAGCGERRHPIDNSQKTFWDLTGVQIPKECNVESEQEEFDRWWDEIMIRGAR